MIRTFFILAICGFILTITSCNNYSNNGDKNLIQINRNHLLVFKHAINDENKAKRDYMGKTIKVTGIVVSARDNETIDDKLGLRLSESGLKLDYDLINFKFELNEFEFNSPYLYGSVTCELSKNYSEVEIQHMEGRLITIKGRIKRIGGVLPFITLTSSDILSIK